MSTTIEELAEQAMTLPIESRARLADLLVESLDTDELGRIEQLWIAEAKRRRDEVRSGTVKASQIILLVDLANSQEDGIPI
jgi:hypothetical protein